MSELSARLVALRKRAGMTQRGVADAMGEARAGQRLVGRLERGGVGSASLVTLVEYLRAVRAGFHDLKDVIDRYTSLPIPEPARKRAEAAPLPRVQTCGRALVNRTDRSYRTHSEARTPNREEERRVLRLRRRAGYWALRRLFEFYLHSGLDAGGVAGWSKFRRIMAAYGRRVFNALYRTHGTKEPKRAERLARLREWAARKTLDRTLAEYSEALAELAYKDMCEHDEIDWMSPEAEARAIMAVKPRRRVVTDAQMCYAEWYSAWSRYSSAALAIYEKAHKAALEVAESARCDAPTLRRYRQAAMRASNIARSTLPDTSKRKQSVANWNTTAWPAAMNRKLLDRILAAALAVWDAGIPTLPPAPGPMPV